MLRCVPLPLPLGQSRFKWSSAPQSKHVIGLPDESGGFFDLPNPSPDDFPPFFPPFPLPLNMKTCSFAPY